MGDRREWIQMVHDVNLYILNLDQVTSSSLFPLQTSKESQHRDNQGNPMLRLISYLRQKKVSNDTQEKKDS